MYSIGEKWPFWIEGHNYQPFIVKAWGCGVAILGVLMMKFF